MSGVEPPCSDWQPDVLTAVLHPPSSRQSETTAGKARKQSAKADTTKNKNCAEGQSRPVIRRGKNCRKKIRLALTLNSILVPDPRVELGTQGFSVLRSTAELIWRNLASKSFARTLPAYGGAELPRHYLIPVGNVGLEPTTSSM